MKFIVLLALVAVSLYAAFNWAFVVDQISQATGIMTGIDADDLQGKKLEPFALPASQCKASFPGTPHAPQLSQEVFAGGIPTGTTRVMADKKQTYYLSEFNDPAMTIGYSTVAGATPTPNVSSVLQGDPFGVNNSVPPPTGNNNLAASANNYSEPLMIQSTLEKFCKNWLTEHKGKEESASPLALKGGLFSGREIRGTMADGAKRFRMRFYCNYPRKTVVAIGVTGDGARVDSADSDKFIGSLDMWN